MLSATFIADESFEINVLVSIVLQLRLELIVTLSWMMIALESLELMVFVSIVFTLSEPEILTASSIWIAVESAEAMELAVSVPPTSNAPVTSTASASVIFVLSAELIVVPFIVTAPATMFPVPAAPKIRSSFDLVASM